jgi:hypothetical protein
MSYKAIRNALQTLVDNNLTAVTGTSKTVHKRIPENILDAQGYSLTIFPDVGTFGNGDTSQTPEVETWNIDVYSPSVGTSYRSEQEDRILDYASALVAVFTNKRDLDVNGIEGMRLKSVRFNDGDYPINSNSTKYHIRVIVEITYNWVRNC